MILGSYELTQQKSNKAKNISINVSGLKGHFSLFPYQHLQYKTVTCNVVTHPVAHSFS